MEFKSEIFGESSSKDFSLGESSSKYFLKFLILSNM